MCATFNEILGKQVDQVVWLKHRICYNGLKSGQWLLFVRFPGSLWYNVNIGVSNLPQRPSRAPNTTKLIQHLHSRFHIGLPLTWQKPLPINQAHVPPENYEYGVLIDL